MKAPVYLTGLGDSAGKTIVTLGLVNDLMNNVKGVGFIKPLGLAEVRSGGAGLDLDAMLVEKTCALHLNIKDMCPVTLSQSTWPEVTPADSQKMLARMKEAFGRVSEGREVTVVEGTGYAALGSSLGLSNGRIAKELGCKAVLVGSYGTMAQNPFDTALLNKAFFNSYGVDVIGLIINRVPADLLDSYRSYAGSRLEHLEIPLLGLLPEEPLFRTFRFLQVSEVLDGEFLRAGVNAENIIKRVRVGAMTPHRAIPFLEPDSMVITPGDREDMVVSICACAARKGGGPTGLVLSGGQRPHERILELVHEFDIPTFLAHEDSYTVASKIHDMNLRIQPTDEEKIAVAQQLVMDNVDLESLVGAL